MFSAALILAIASIASAQIQWNRDQNGDWASDCDFPGNDISWQQTQGPDCSAYCRSVSGCTQYSYYQGWCYAKSGGLGRGNAVVKAGVTCGINNPPGNPTPSGPGGDIANAVQLMNNLRGSLGVSPLSYDNGLQSGAQNQANSLASQNCQLDHQGQVSNLYGIYGVDGIPGDMFTSSANGWISEGPGPYPDHGHYNVIANQAGWNVNRVGCAAAYNSNQRCAVVSCFYA
ncbi:hypothetical protein HDV06_002213 [Boothiomyces sp. JEL0866]|nr:hypothetical protein HDV06_002213 [Boothiomyces sp. JEL0866]